MLVLADASSIQAMKTLELLRMMVDCCHATIERVISAAGYWRFANDLPKDYDTDSRRLSHRCPP